MANPFGAETVDYGTVSGQGPGFRGKSEFTMMKEEISGIVMEIKQGTQKLNRDIERLGTSADTENFRGRMQGNLRSTLDKVKRSKAMLNQLMRLAATTDERGSQLAVRGLQQSLAAAINDFQVASQEAMRKMDSSEPLAQSIASVHSDVAEVEEDSDRARLVMNRKAQQQQNQQQQFMVSDEASHLEARAHRMEAVEGDIRTLNEIMVDIGNMVHEQGETIDHIEGNVDAAYDDVQHGNQQLEKGVRLKKCSRKLTCAICIIVGSIVAIVILIIIIVAVKYAPNKNSNKKNFLDY